MHLAREHEGVQHGAKIVNLFAMRQPSEFGIQESHVERRVVNDQLCPADEFEQFFGDLIEPGLLSKKLIRDAVNLESTSVYFTVGSDVAMERATGLASPDDFDASDFDDAVSLFRLEASGFGVEYDLAHVG
jgi:hypothetical protein